MNIASYNMLNVLYKDIKKIGTNRQRTEGKKEEQTNGKSHKLRWLHRLKIEVPYCLTKLSPIPSPTQAQLGAEICFILR